MSVSVDILIIRKMNLQVLKDIGHRTIARNALEAQILRNYVNNVNKHKIPLLSTIMPANQPIALARYFMLNVHKIKMCHLTRPFNNCTGRDIYLVIFGQVFLQHFLKQTGVRGVCTRIRIIFSVIIYCSSEYLSHTVYPKSKFCFNKR